MKYLSYLLFIFILFYSCSNEGGKSPMMVKTKNDVSSFTFYKGSARGAMQVNLSGDTLDVNQVDSLKKICVHTKYFASSYASIKSLYARTSFEINGQYLTYIDDSGKQYLSSYRFVDDSLFILVNGEDPLFVAQKGDGGTFYRLKTLQRHIINSGSQRVDTTIIGDTLLTLQDVLIKSGINDSLLLTNVNDSLMWCNLKYVFE